MRALQTPIAPHRSERGRKNFASDEMVWLFDLDNTLHDCSRFIFTQIDQHMTRAVMQTLDVDIDTANRLRKQYWKRYGATVIGMVRNHGVNARRFLALSHDFDPAPLVHAESALANKLDKLKGRKILLTNAPLDYARQVLKTLGILRHFESIWTMDHMTLQGQIRPKPTLALMRQVLARVGAPARQVVLVEDTLRNLKVARQVGMRTVHVFHPGTPFSGMHGGRPNYVDMRINSLSQLLTGQRTLRR